MKLSKKTTEIIVRVIYGIIIILVIMILFFLFEILIANG